jgi:tRNA(Ile2) C34 agmatinyltransferase TiaS
MMFINEQGLSRMNDDDIIRQRIAGKSVRAIAKSARTSVSEVNAVIDRWASVALTSEARKHGLALELARLDELQRTFYEKALGGDIASGALCEKIIARRCVMLGLHAPQTADRACAQCSDRGPEEKRSDHPLIIKAQHVAEMI